jgi:hypothetical protein
MNPGRILGTALWVISATAAAQEAPEPDVALAQARAAYDAFEFDRCVALLEPHLEQQALPGSERAHLQMWLGLCEHQRRNVAAAQRHFDAALTLDRTLALPPHTSPKISSLFENLRSQRLVSSEAIPTVSKASRPSWLPLVALGVTAVAAGTAVGLGVTASRFESDSHAAVFQSDILESGGKARAFATGANVAYASAVVSLAAAATLYWLEHRALPTARAD